jgi:Ni,Fe-hydrogenase I small subunit
MNKIAGWTPLFSRLVISSSVWQESKEVKILWVTMLALVGRDSVVEASVPALANLAGLTVHETEAALGVLLSPDEYSHSKEMEGRRIVVVDGGWRLINHGKYREMASREGRKQQLREAQVRYRMKRGKPLAGETAAVKALARGDEGEFNRLSEGAGT